MFHLSDFLFGFWLAVFYAWGSFSRKKEMSQKTKYSCNWVCNFCHVRNMRFEIFTNNMNSLLKDRDKHLKDIHGFEGKTLM